MPKAIKKRSSASSATPASVAQQQKPGGAAKSTKANSTSKQASLVAMLQSANGATIAAMMKATGWQQHSVRGFLAGVVRKRLKLNLSSKKVDGERLYQVAIAKRGKQAVQASSQPR